MVARKQSAKIAARHKAGKSSTFVDRFALKLIWWKNLFEAYSTHRDSVCDGENVFLASADGRLRGAGIGLSKHIPTGFQIEQK
jgi:hypothetical protein